MLRARSKAGASLSIVVTRADGTVHDYGVVASNSRYFRLIGRHIARIRTNRLNRRLHGDIRR